MPAINAATMVAIFWQVSLEYDLPRFPDRQTITFARQVNREFHWQLLNLLAERPDDPLLLQVLEENQQLYRAWDMLDDCHCRFRDDFRYERLQKLRSLLGEEAWFAARMPPYLPIWRFRRSGEW
jgi:hypothetical protein